MNGHMLRCCWGCWLCTHDMIACIEMWWSHCGHACCHCTSQQGPNRRSFCAAEAADLKTPFANANGCLLQANDSDLQPQFKAIAERIDSVLTLQCNHIVSCVLVDPQLQSDEFLLNDIRNDSGYFDLLLTLYVLSDHPLVPCHCCVLVPWSERYLKDNHEHQHSSEKLERSQTGKCLFEYA